MQNKPNLLDTQMNVTYFYTVDYENIANWKLGENKANSKPIKPNTNPKQTQFAEKPKMNVTSILTKDYEEKCG